MDELDRKILRLLEENARMTLKEIAKRIALTSPAVSERIRRMEKQGIITGYTVQLNTNYDQNMTNALISISIPIEDRAAFKAMLENQEEIMKCYHVTGSHSHMMRVRCKNIASLEQLLGRLQTLGHTNTQIILSDMPVRGPKV